MKTDFEKLTEKSGVIFENLSDRFLRWWFSKWPKRFNDWARIIDRKLNEIQPTIGHPRTVVWLGIASLLIIIVGPSASLLTSFVFNEWPGNFVMERIIGLIVAASGVLFLGFSSKKFQGKNLHNIQCITLMLLGLLVFILPDKYTEASGASFPHIYALIIIVLMFLTIVARWFSDYVMRTMLAAGNFNNASIDNVDECSLKEDACLLADLIHDRNLDLMVNVQKPPIYSRPNALRALFSAPARKPLLLVLFPAIAAIMFPDVFLARIAATIVFFFVWAMFSWGMYYRHWDLVVSYFERLFMLGGPMFVSILVIVLGTGHLLNIQYITTALQGGPIISLVLSSYLVFWLFEYWTNKFFYENLMRVFKTGYPQEDQSWSITFDTNNTEKVDKISILGSSRFLVHDAQKKTDDKFRIYMPFLLLDRIALDNGERARDAVREVKNRIRTYFSMRNIALLLSFVAIFLSFQFFNNDPNPMIILKQNSLFVGKSNIGDNEKNLLVKRLKEIASGDNKKAVLIAASGGGSRAALYTTSLLCGLHQLGIDKNIAFLSTVSGGSAAAAYYAANIDKLKGFCDTNKLANSKHGAWHKFYETMQFSYIDDVLGGIVERRIVGPDQNGVLLAESFKRHFESDRTLSEVDEFGLIFNSTITGHPYHESQILSKLFIDDAKNKCIDGQYKIHAGSRLIFTNLPSIGFPKLNPDFAMDAFLNYKVINNRFKAEINKKSYKSVPLFAAAALSANFPPIFSDAGLQFNRIDNGRKCDDLYWVTDGGATDNRGFVSLLYALLEALNSFEKAEKLPELHVVVAEASAEPIDYNQIRGIGGKLDASSHLASQLSIRLVKEINQLVFERNKDTCENCKSSMINIHYLELPAIFRTRGGFGTHWKLPLRVAFTNPTISNKDDANNNNITLWRSEALNLMAQIHGSECKGKINEKLIEWLCVDDSHQNVWSELTKKLKPTKISSNKTQ